MARAFLDRSVDHLLEDDLLQEFAAVLIVGPRGYGTQLVCNG